MYHLGECFRIIKLFNVELKGGGGGGKRRTWISWMDIILVNGLSNTFKSNIFPVSK